MFRLDDRYGVGIIGSCSDFGVHVDGAFWGPKFILRHWRRLRGVPIADLWLPPLPKSDDPADKAKNLQAVDYLNYLIYQQTQEYLEEGLMPVNIGGDHSVVIGSTLASREANGNIGIIWIDAHTDYHTAATTISGNLHGLPLATINGLVPMLTPFHPGPFIDPRKTVILGARSVDRPEWWNLRRAGVRVMPMREVIIRGIDACLDEAWKIATKGGTRAHVSFDLDAINPEYAPGVSVPEAGGFDRDDVGYLIKNLSYNIRLMSSFDIVEYNPFRDQEKKTLRMARKILRDVIVHNL